jgi:hypothetical protein
MHANGQEQDTLRHSAEGAAASGFCTVLPRVFFNFSFIKSIRQNESYTFDHQFQITQNNCVLYRIQIQSENFE